MFKDKINKRLLAFVMLTFSISQSYADLSPQVMNNIDTIVTQSMQQDGIPGLALGIVQNGQPVLVKGYGFADLQSQQPVTGDTLFAIGSVSKVMTAFALLNLVQQGKVGLNDSILQYIPDAPQQWKNVTIKQLLSHTSGIPQHQGPHLPWANVWAQMSNQPMQFSPGTGVKYNNFGYILLSRVIEVASNQRYANYLNDNLFGPLHMQQTGFPNTLMPMGLATGYRYQNGQEIVTPNRRPWLQMWGSGGIVSSMNDMVKWDIAMYNGQLLKPKTYDLMWTPLFLANGQPAGHKHWAWSLGWQVAYINNTLRAYKNGAITGYSSFYIRYIDDKISIIILCNNKNTHLHRLATLIYRQIKFNGNLPGATPIHGTTLQNGG